MITLFWRGKKFPMQFIGLKPKDENAVMGTVKHGGWGFGFTKNGVQYFYSIVGYTCRIDGVISYEIDLKWNHVANFKHLIWILIGRDKYTKPIKDGEL